MKGDDDEAATAEENAQTGLVRVRVREIELGESMSSGEFEVGKQQENEKPLAINSEGRGGIGSDDDDENCDEWEEEEGESNGTQEEEEALVRKQRPSVMQRESGGSEA